MLQLWALVGELNLNFQMELKFNCRRIYHANITNIFRQGYHRSLNGGIFYRFRHPMWNKKTLKSNNFVVREEEEWYTYTKYVFFSVGKRRRKDAGDIIGRRIGYQAAECGE